MLSPTHKTAYFDWFSFLIIMIISCCGLMMVFSATYQPQHPFSIYFYKQFAGIISGIIIYFLFYYSDYRSLVRYGYFAYFGMLLLLIFTIIKGSVGMGAQRWIDLKIVKFQPSELAKLLLAPFVVYTLENEYASERTVYDFLPIIGFLGISFILVLKQPDLGTGLIIAFSGCILLWYAGISKKFILGCALSFLVALPILYSCLHDYQKRRIEVFLGAGDVKKERYHVEQSKIAIGSGGFWGKGLLEGTQSQLHFLPESRTDFIFSVLSEEFGFFGACCLLLLYIMLILRSLYMIYTIEQFYDQLLAIGLLSPIAISIIINTGMVTGLLPVVGIPLPLMSYGITHLWINFAILGWLNAITSRSRIAS